MKSVCAISRNAHCRTNPRAVKWFSIESSAQQVDFSSRTLHFWCTFENHYSIERKSVSFFIFFPVVVCNLVQYCSTNARILRRIELNLIMNFKNLFEITPILPRWFVHSQPQFSQCVLKLQFCVPLEIVLITRISISRRKEIYKRKCDWFHSSQKQFTTTAAAAAAREIHKKAVKEWIIAHSDWFATKSVGWCVLKIDGDRMKIVFP